MKIYLKYFAAIASIILIQACDKIEPPYRETTAGITGANDSTVIVNGDTIIFGFDNSAAVKKVLVEDYTGHLCGNCPYAGILLNDTLKNIFHSQLVVVSVHAGFFATACPGIGCPSSAPAGSFATDFTNSTSNAWDVFFGISAGPGNPNGMVDRIGYPATHVKAPTSWGTHIQNEATLTPKFKIRIINHYNAASHQLVTAVQSQFLNATTDTVKLQVVLTEDSIVDWQEWYPPHTTQYDPTYVHHHVLRAGINGSFGAVISNGGASAGKINIQAFTSALNPNWNASRCKVVAFVYDASDYKVLQVEEADIQ